MTPTKQDDALAALERIEVALQFYADRFKNTRGSQIQANVGLGAVDIIRAHLSKLSGGES